MLSPEMRPLRPTASNLLGNILQIGKRFAVSVNGDRRETLPVTLHQAVGAQHDGIPAAELLVKAQGAFSEAGVVGLQRSAVIAELGVEVSAPENSSFLPHPTSGGKFQACIFRVGRRVDRAALPGGNENESVAAEHLRSHREIPLTHPGSSPDRKIRGALVAIGGLKQKRRMLGLASDELHHAAQCVAAIKVRGSSAKYLDVRNRLSRQPIPIHP